MSRIRLQVCLSNRLAIVAIVFTVFAVELMAAQKKTATQENAGERNQLSTTINETNNCVPAQQKENSADSVQGWHKLITWPGSWETWALIVTFGVITWQACLMRVHAKHLRRLTEHIATSERAWMVANVEKLRVPHSQLSNDIVSFSVRCMNKGKTPAFLLEIGNHGVAHPRDTILPAVQPPYEPQNVEKWDGDGLPLQPGADVVRHNITITPCTEKIHIGQNDLWIYGYIKYRDAFGIGRETWYCFLWDYNCSKSIEEDKPSCYMPDGPPGYNRAT